MQNAITMICLSLLLGLLSCGGYSSPGPGYGGKADGIAAAATAVGNIPAPAGYQRVAARPQSFTVYLRSIPLKASNTVYLYDGSKKPYQGAQYAVLDISVGKKDLQQCADAVMRLRAEYFYGKQQFSAINFKSGDGTSIAFDQWLQGIRYKPSGNKLIPVSGAKSNVDVRQQFDNYLDMVFSYCGTASMPLVMQQKPLAQMQVGDVLLKPGSPGHAVIVMDMVENTAGKKKYLLAQSYMPAQDIHVLKNPEETIPWYDLDERDMIITPEWNFSSNQLYGWK